MHCVQGSSAKPPPAAAPREVPSHVLSIDRLMSFPNVHEGFPGKMQKRKCQEALLPVRQGDRKNAQQHSCVSPDHTLKSREAVVIT